MSNTKRKPKTVDPEAPKETKEDKLRRLANARVTKACKYISLCGNLAAYKPTLEDAEKIVGALANACQSVETRLSGATKTVVTFSLK
jgi:hypothetical protein